MKSRFPRRATVRIVAALALTIFCSTTVNAWARPPRARERQCVIQTIELNSRTMTLQCGKDTQPLELVWTKDTKFLKNWQFSDSAQLKPSQPVTVFYHSPFFGKTFATKVVWQNGSDDKLNKNQSTQRKEI